MKAAIRCVGIFMVCACLVACQHKVLPAEKAPQFDVGLAKQNLAYATTQYMKMIRLVEAEQDIEVSKGCPDIQTCAPRAIEHGKILLETRKRWTNGFYPGVLWMLLNSSPPKDSSDLDLLWDKAHAYTDVVLEEAPRTRTHDLGMILHFPVAYALKNPGLASDRRAQYEAALTTGRESLATRYRDEEGVIRSWSWYPSFRARYIDEDGRRDRDTLDLAEPWQYPVIIDNMMNLEFLYTSDNPEHQRMAFQHATNTMLNQFFYEADDTKKERPIAYHVFDYGEKKPGNWQGLGVRSAWARGQGWALYGFVVSAIHAQRLPQAVPSEADSSSHTDYKRFVEHLVLSLDHFLEEQKVPLWDFYASRDDAYDIASDLDPNTVLYHHMLTLCLDQVPTHITPYVGFNPVLFPQQLLSEEGQSFLVGKQNRYGSPMLQHGQVVPCGRKPFVTAGRQLPRDTSAAALYASALYRMADFLLDGTAPSIATSKKYEAFADAIMAELSSQYRSDRNKSRGYELGFVLDAATGNLPQGLEIDTGIVYADYFFIEANILKLQLANKRARQPE